MSQLVNYISQRGNSLNIENQGIQNLVTGTQLDKKAFQFLLNVVPIGESAYDGRPRFEKVDMRKNLFDNIPKTRIPTTLSTKKKKKQYIKRNNSFNAKYSFCKIS